MIMLDCELARQWICLPRRNLMWRRSAFLVTAIAVQLFCLVAAARSDDIDCDSFVRNDDGSWTVVKKAYVSGPNVRVEEGATFEPGGTFLGDDLAKRLDRACPHAAAPPPQPAAVAPAQGARTETRIDSRSALARLADANGNIDVQHVTCGQLADATPAESELLLAYFSGWYGGLAKRRGINLARVRYAIRTVGDFCKINRDKSLVQTMDMMLK
jgi:hypothetical protein